MSGTQVTMQREVLKTAEDSASYVITASCTVRGTLTDTSIFLLTIVTPADPKDDTLARVVDITDFETYGTNRDTVIAGGGTLWRSSSVTLRYEDVVTANAAWKELSNRINTLVQETDTYLDEFNTFSSGEVIVYPAVDESEKTALINTYLAAADALAEAEAAFNGHSCSVLEDEIDTLESQIQDAQSDLNNYTSVKAAITANYAALSVIQGGYSANTTSTRAANEASSATTEEQDAIETILRSNEAYNNQFVTQLQAKSSTLSGGISTAVTTLQARVTTLTADKNAKMTDLNKCNIETSKLQAAVDSARATREAALAAVLAACPDYVPTR